MTSVAHPSGRASRPRRDRRELLTTHMPPRVDVVLALLLEAARRDRPNVALRPDVAMRGPLGTCGVLTGAVGRPGDDDK